MKNDTGKRNGGHLRSLYASGLLAMGLLGSLTIASAQQTGGAAGATAVPRLVHFAGSFHPPADQPTGPVGATFAIYGEQDGGAALWSEDQNVALDANGNYAVLLGSTKNGGVPMELFAAGEARWLQVKFHLPDEVTAPRVLLVSVPYALKAADAETIGGLPPSAFVLAATTANGETGAMSGRDVAASASASATPAVTGTGTTDFVPLWTDSTGTLGNSVLFQSGSGATATVGINTTTPATTLDVNGTATLRGDTVMAAIGVATTKGGKKSQPLDFAGSAFNSGTSSAVAQTFRLQTEAAGNDTTSPSATLNLLYGSGAATPAETGLKLASNGQIEFATGQTFPGAGTITGVTAGSGLMGGGVTGDVTVGLTNTCASGQVLQWNGSAWACAAGGSGGGGITGMTAGTDLTGGGTSGSVTLNLDTTKVPQLNTANTFTGNETVNGNLSATGVVSGSSYQIGNTLFAFGNYTNQNAFLGFGGNSTMTGTNNTGVGLNALRANYTGSYNTAVGSGTLSQNGGDGNTAIGYGALAANENGTYNTANGSSAMFTNNTGYYNVAMGNGTLYGNTSGYGNTALGTGALGANTTGAYNTAVGYVAGSGTSINYEVTGEYNTYLGYAAGPGSQTQFFNVTAIGAGAVVNQNYAMALGGTAEWAVNIGIGTATPYFDYALDVEDSPTEGITGGVVVNGGGGNLYLGMTSGTHEFRVDYTGKGFFNGGTQTGGADFAESVAVGGQRSLYEPGDVLEIDQSANRHLTLSHHAYATLVAGIYSTKPGVLATEHNMDDPAIASSEVPLAVVGIVPCKVSTENGTIARGDLLVTSSRPGYAMKGTNRRRMLGAVVGKALEPLEKGSGVIQVLVTLQ